METRFLITKYNLGRQIIQTTLIINYKKWISISKWTSCHIIHKVDEGLKKDKKVDTKYQVVNIANFTL